LEECLAAIEHRSAEFNPGPPLAQLGEVALFEGSLEEAQRNLQRAIEYLPEEDAIFRAMAFSDLAELALLKGDFHQAQRWLELARAPAGLHIRRALVFLCTLAGYLTLGSSDLSTLALAASLYAAIGALCERSGVKLISFYRSRNEERMRLLRAKLPAQAWQQAEAFGRSWSLAEAMEQVV
jgi:tetratricopeptide (TPR) repeat protein